MGEAEVWDKAGVPAEARNNLQEVRLCPEEMEPDPLAGLAADVAAWVVTVQDPDQTVAAYVPTAEKGYLTSREFLALIKAVPNAELNW